MLLTIEGTSTDIDSKTYLLIMHEKIDSLLLSYRRVRLATSEIGHCLAFCGYVHLRMTLYCLSSSPYDHARL